MRHCDSCRTTMSWPAASDSTFGIRCPRPWSWKRCHRLVPRSCAFVVTTSRRDSVSSQGHRRFSPSFPRARPAIDLGFARWLVSGEHPLTARVIVNRYWQSLFGAGLVRTAEDFGVQGEAPSHPELLDWLASEFVRLDWDIKEIQKRILMSATYRQASRIDAVAWERDPQNRLLARGPRQRLAAHVLRDQALYVSGLLVEQLGGPSVESVPASQPLEGNKQSYVQTVRRAPTSIAAACIRSGSAPLRPRRCRFWTRRIARVAPFAENAPIHRYRP